MWSARIETAKKQRGGALTNLKEACLEDRRN